MPRHSSRKPSLISNIRPSVATYIPFLVERFQFEKQGGWIYVLEKSSLFWNVTLHDSIGVIPQDKDRKYHRLSEEKAQRLTKHPDHHTSFMSRNEYASQWGGAIRTFSDPECILSFSGFTEAWDEALVLAVACDLNLMNHHQARSIASPSALDPFTELFFPIQAS